MAMTHQRADVTLNATLRGGATPHIWLHTGDPGVNGTALVAKQPNGTVDIVRKPISFNAPANHPTNVERRCLSAAQVAWLGSEVNPGQTFTHCSIWSAATAGQPEHITLLGTAKMVGSDGVTMPAGEVEVTIVVHVRP